VQQVPEVEDEGTAVVDLMSALRRSVERARGGGGDDQAEPKKAPAKKAAAKKATPVKSTAKKTAASTSTAEKKTTAKKTAAGSSSKPAKRARRSA
jgi:DNA end-binding protein Ku